MPGSEVAGSIESRPPGGPVYDVSILGEMSRLMDRIRTLTKNPVGESVCEVHNALRSLSAEYAAGVDRRQAELLLGAFHPDATLIVHRSHEESGRRPHQMSGRGEIARVLEIVSRYPATFHQVGQARYRVWGETASGEVYCVANHFTTSDQGKSNLVMYIRYEDEYRRDSSGVWRIQRREVHPDWTESRPMSGAPAPSG